MNFKLNLQAWRSESHLPEKVPSSEVQKSRRQPLQKNIDMHWGCNFVERLLQPPLAVERHCKMSSPLLFWASEDTDIFPCCNE